MSQEQLRAMTNDELESAMQANYEERKTHCTDENKALQGALHAEWDLRIGTTSDPMHY